MKAALLALLPLANAHLCTVCTSTQSSEGGTVRFYLGTYHHPTSVAPGTFHIKTPSNLEITGIFNDNKGASKPNGNFNAGSQGSVFEASISATYSLPSDATVQCFKRQSSSSIGSGSGYTLYQAEVLPSTSSGDACFGSTIHTWYRATINNAMSGNFEVWTSGTDINLDPNSWNWPGSPCSMAHNKHIVFPLTVAAAGRPCSGFTGSISGATVPATCQTTVMSGFVCPVSCSLNSAGELKCDDASWVNSYSCVASVCQSPSSSNSGFSGIAGVTGAGCGFTTADGVSCNPTCSGTNWAAATDSVTCNNGQWTTVSGSGCNAPSADVPPAQPAMTGGTTSSGTALGVTSDPSGTTTVAWSAPANNGGSPIVSYNIAVTAGSCTGLQTTYNSGTPPAGGLSCTAATPNLAVSVSACNSNSCTSSPPMTANSNTQGGGSAAGPTLTISGDPFTTNAQGEKVQFWLPLNKEAHLLTCNNVRLLGHAMPTGIDGDSQQWFHRFVVVVDGEQAVKAEIVNGTLKLTEGPGSGYLLDATKDSVRVRAGSVAMGFSVAKASKFNSKQEQMQYTHLDMQFKELDTKLCSAGILAEIWGVAPMSEATTKMLQAPERRARKLGCEPANDCGGN